MDWDGVKAELGCVQLPDVGLGRKQYSPLIVNSYTTPSCENMIEGGMLARRTSAFVFAKTLVRSPRFIYFLNHKWNLQDQIISRI